MLQRPETNIKQRFFAGLIDYTIIYAVTFTLIFLLGESDGQGTYSLNGLPALLPVLFWFILTVGLETALGGTLGNSIVRLKALQLVGPLEILRSGNL